MESWPQNPEFRNDLMYYIHNLLNLNLKKWRQLFYIVPLAKEGHNSL